jgi:UDP-N-acetylmuramate--alanine ligase
MMFDQKTVPLQAMWKFRRIHFVGIGGAGMGGIAEVLLHEGHQVSGSDLQENAMVRHLAKLGVKIFKGQKAEQIENVDLLVRSTAVADDNPELVAARKARIPIIPRAQMLAELMRFRYGVAVAGTHGKTTTTSLIASVLAEAKLDPTFVIGGLLNRAGSNAHLGVGEFLVAEADESDASFLYLKPIMAVVTNIDADHMETYGGSFTRLQQTFVEFLHHLPFYGLAVMCLDDPVVKECLPRLSRPIVTYGFDACADFRASDYSQQALRSFFTVHRPNLPPLEIELNLGGRHNVLNALACIAIATELHVEDRFIVKALAEFSGVGRRLQVFGNVVMDQKQVMVIDDYGHHPREIHATIDAMRNAWPNRRLVMAYQPHRYTRTRDLFEDFVHILSQVDALLLLDIYSAGESPITGITSAALISAIAQQKKVSPLLVESVAKLPDVLTHILQDNDLLLLQGAGDISTAAPQLMTKFQVLSTA